MMRKFWRIAAVAATIGTVHAAEDYAGWPRLTDPFPSTGGGGVMIGGYDPVVADGKCRTPFTATTTDGSVYRNTVEFDAVETQGGILCANGRWTSADGTASGTTPFRLFIKDGVRRMSPD